MYPLLDSSQVEKVFDHTSGIERKCMTYHSVIFSGWHLQNEIYTCTIICHFSSANSYNESSVKAHKWKMHAS